MAEQQPCSAASSALAEMLFTCLITVLRGRADDLARFAATGNSFEDWVLWEWMAAASRYIGWAVHAEPRYARHKLQGPSPEARGDLLVVVPDGVRVWSELALVHDETGSKWYGEGEKISEDRRRLECNGGRDHDLALMQVIVVASRTTISETLMDKVKRSGCWTNEPSFRASLPLSPAGEVLVVAWLVSKSAAMQ